MGNSGKRQLLSFRNSHAVTFKTAIFKMPSDDVSFSMPAVNLKTFCRVVAIGYLSYSVVMFYFHLCTFASPNFEVLINLSILSESASTFSRMWYSLANIAFWSTYMVTTTLIFLATNWGFPELVAPFCWWSLIGIVWEIILVCFKIAYFQGSGSALIILWKLLFVGVTIFAIVAMFKFTNFQKAVDNQCVSKEKSELQDSPQNRTYTDIKIDATGEV
jgi:hypothetical protein